MLVLSSKELHFIPLSIQKVFERITLRVGGSESNSEEQVPWKSVDIFSPHGHAKQVWIPSGSESKAHKIILSFPCDSSCLWLVFSEWGVS